MIFPAGRCCCGCCRCRSRSRPTSPPTSTSICSSRWAWSSARSRVWFPLQDAVRMLPNLRSLPGAIFVIALVLYPYVYLSARTMFQSQSAEFAEAARTLGAGRWTTFWRISLPMARPALAVGLALVSLETLNDIGASEYLGVRTLTVSIFTTWLNRGSLAGAAQIVLLHAGDRGRPDRDRALRPPQRHDGVFRRKPAADAADAAHRHAAAVCAFAACLLPVALGFLRAAAVSRASEFQARTVCEFRHGVVARRLQLGRVREPRHADRAAARLCDHSRLALAARPRCASSR